MLFRSQSDAQNPDWSATLHLSVNVILNAHNALIADHLTSATDRWVCGTNDSMVDIVSQPVELHQRLVQNEKLQDSFGERLFACFVGVDHFRYCC